MPSFQAFCPAERCIQAGKVCKNRTRQLGVYGSRQLAREAQLHHLHSSSNHYLEMDEARQIDGEHCIIPYVDETVAPEPRRARSRSTRSARSQDRELRRSIAELNTRFDVVMSSLVRSEQAVLRAERVATEAALSFREEARILEDTIAAITPVYEGE
jgi:hypothetical protein